MIRPWGQVVDLEFPGLSGINATQVDKTSSAIAVASMAMEVEQLMGNYPSVVNSSKKLLWAKHLVEHIIETL